MNRCKQCNVIISDNTTVCPLCRCAVEASSAECINDYPNIGLATRKLKHVCNIVLLTVIAASAALITCNAVFYSGSLWSMIPVGAMIFAYMIFRIVVISNKGYRIKVFVPFLLVAALVLVIDIETGYSRWSVNYVIPAEILVADIIILSLMLTNLRNWQSYIVMEIAATVTAVLMLVLWGMGVVTEPVVSIIAFSVSALLTVAAVIIGDRSAKAELKRRFHIR